MPERRESGLEDEEVPERRESGLEDEDQRFSKAGDEDKEGSEMIKRAEESELKGSIEQSLSLLRQVNIGDHGKDSYIRSREKLGQMYLKYRKDKQLYITCYKEVSEVVASNETHLKLGDAFMNILEPEKAIDVYERVFEEKSQKCFSHQESWLCSCPGSLL